MSRLDHLIVVAHLCFGMETVGQMFVKRAFSRLSEIKYVAATPFAVFAVLSDILIAGALCVLLFKSRSEIKGTNTLVNRLMVYAVNRCLLTSVVALAETVMYATMPQTLWFLGIDFTIGKLYANSLLATLNTRHSLRGRGTESETGEPEYNSMRFVGLSALERNGQSESASDGTVEQQSTLGFRSKEKAKENLGKLVNISIAREVTEAEP
ncbi:hypothetical protein B0H21DRAFT_894774 [Amylocystis lapponica]|nr:hypothetical protein B0H21DRAFT_894774 [Amylocystis lapponica]